MFYFRINRVKIFNNRESKFLIFEKDEAEVEFWSFITTNNTKLPDVGGLLETNDFSKRRSIVEEMVEEVVDSRVIAPIKNVKDDHIMMFGDTGLVLHQSEEIPNDLNWNLIAIEIDESSRDTAKLFQEVINDSDFDSFVDGISNLVGKSLNPTFTAARVVGKFVTQVIFKQIENNDDDLIGNLMMSLNRTEHYPHGERKKDGVIDITGNMEVDYSLFGFDPEE